MFRPGERLLEVRAALARRRLGAIVLSTAALAGAGCGSSGSSSSSTTASGFGLTLDLKAGGNAYNVAKCGVAHHYTTYRATHRIEYAAQLTPGPGSPWAEKLKIEGCRGNTFATVATAHAPGDKHGYVSSFLPRVDPGYYFARVYYYTGRKTAAQSDKEYFRVGGP